MTFSVRWPDGRVADCYSPSLVMHDHLRVGASYTVAEFADRVRAAYGFACTSAMASRDEIRRVAGRFAADEQVQVLAMQPPLPDDGP